jgi:hypothetical protein
LRIKSLFSIAALILPLIWITPSCAEDNDSARSFLESVYRQYGKDGPGIDLTGPKAGQFFHSTLIALVRADQAMAGPDTVGALDGDPVCSCQDWDGVRDLKIGILVQSNLRAKAEVSFALGEVETGIDRDLRTLEITLTRENGKWRIYDILDESDPKSPIALRAALKLDIQRVAHSKPKSNP